VNFNKDIFDGLALQLTGYVRDGLLQEHGYC